MIRKSIAAATLAFAATHIPFGVHADDAFVRSGNYRLTQTQVEQYMELVEAVFDTRFSAAERGAIADYLKIEFNTDPPASVKSWQNVKQAHAQLTNGGPLQHLRTRARVLADFHCAFIADEAFHSGPGKAFADLMSAKDPLLAEDCANKKVVTRQSFAAQARTEALVAKIVGAHTEPGANAKFDRRALLELNAETRSQFTDAVLRAGVTERIMAAVPKAERKRVGDVLAGALRQTNSLPAVARELESEVMRAVARVEQKRVEQNTAATSKYLDVMGYGLSLQMMTGVLHPGGMAIPSGQ
jgi:hypothetical protein